MLMASPSMRVGLERLAQFQRYWGDGERAKMIATKGGVTVRYTFTGTGDDYQRQSDECAMAEILIGFRAISGRDVVPRAVRFRHPAPADTREHTALFRCTVEFRAQYTEIDFDDASLDAPLPHANETYCLIFQGQVERALARLPGKSGTAVQVRAAARALLLGGQCTLSGTARTLGMSVRTLQRRLRDDGTSFGELLDSLRRELATEYLDKRLTVSEIAWLLGYAEPSAFHHAFKRWTGTTPEAVRAARGRQTS
jgi:AraC-like DNA-binding protein